MHLIAGIIKLLGGLVVLLLRLALPIAIIALAIYLIHRGSGGGTRRDTGGAAPREERKPHFKGPVMTVPYREVKEDSGAKDAGAKDTGGEGKA